MGNLTNETILIVDLASGETYKEDIDEEFYESHIGGVRINLALFEKYQEEDPIILGTGLLTGTLVPGSALGIVTAKSPQTGKVCHAPICIYGGMELKYAGFDFVVIKGISPNPVYLWLHDEVADINDAVDLMGKDSWATTDELRKSLGEDIIQVLNIGPAGERQSDLAQIILNYWATGDRWGFGKLLGQKNVKAIALRGMGIFDLEDEEGFVDACADLFKAFKDEPSLSGKKGIIDIAAAMGEDITDWLSPIIHRHSADYNCPYPINTFVKYNEDPTILKETDVAETGFYLTDIYGLLEFKKMGLSAEDSCRMLEACAREGINAVAAADLLRKTGKTALNDLKQAVSGLTGPIESPEDSVFSPWSPKQPLFVDFGLPDDGSRNSEWWVRRQAVAYLFGIHPIFILMAPMLTEEKLINAVNLGTGLNITADTVDEAIKKVCG